MKLHFIVWATHRLGLPNCRAQEIGLRDSSLDVQSTELAGCKAPNRQHRIPETVRTILIVAALVVLVRTHCYLACQCRSQRHGMNFSVDRSVVYLRRKRRVTCNSLGFNVLVFDIVLRIATDVEKKSGLADRLTVSFNRVFRFLIFAAISRFERHHGSRGSRGVCIRSTDGSGIIST